MIHEEAQKYIEELRKHTGKEHKDITTSSTTTTTTFLQQQQSCQPRIAFR
jgi:hypothetical protein